MESESKPRKPKKKRMDVSINCRLPAALLEKLDAAVARGVYLDRSDGIRNCLMVGLITTDPEIQRMGEDLVTFLDNPVLPKFASAMEVMLEELTPEKMGEIVEIIAGPMADYFSGMFGFRADELKAEIMKGMTGPKEAEGEA